MALFKRKLSNLTSADKQMRIHVIGTSKLG